VYCCSYGGWIIDGFPANKDQWSLLLERGKNLPDHVVFLHDESPNGDLLIKRWYTTSKADDGVQAERYTKAWLRVFLEREKRFFSL